jgi:hypothetical protein
MNNPLSLVPAEGNSNEFPVLKAFQEYIDAEQAKARKRMLGLSVFFIVLLSVVVVTFVLILTTVLNRNQSLSDRLLDYALKERDKTTPVMHLSQPMINQSDSIVKTLVERLEKEQAEMKAAILKQQKESDEKTLAAERKHIEELNKVRQELANERAKIKKIADNKAEIERHRRRLYPDYYRLESDEKLPLPLPSSYDKPRTIEALPETANKNDTVKPQSLPQRTRTVSPLSSLKPVTYFNLDDEDSVPFLIETPKQNK